jgi:hypothetical protein
MRTAFKSLVLAAVSFYLLIPGMAAKSFADEVTALASNVDTGSLED